MKKEERDREVEREGGNREMKRELEEGREGLNREMKREMVYIIT